MQPVLSLDDVSVKFARPIEWQQRQSLKAFQNLTVVFREISCKFCIHCSTQCYQVSRPTNQIARLDINLAYSFICPVKRYKL